MKKENNKKSASALIGAAFLMATSAIGPGFLTQTGKFTDSLHGSFGFVILISVILAAIVQLNVWRVLCVSGMRGQDVANKVLPGLGYVIAFLVVAGGLVFNIGNVGGGALGFNTLLGIPTTAGYFIAGAIAILVFLMKNAMNAMDNLTKVLGGIMILVIFIVILIVQPPIGMAAKETVLPTASMGDIFPAILTLLGGTVGGYITFAGAHRLIDAGITGKENLKEINKSSVMGMGIATIVRIFLFLAVLGVVVATATSPAHTLDAANPTADAFLQGAGQIGYRFFGLVILCAAITSIVGCAYTSVSFLKTFSKTVYRWIYRSQHNLYGTCWTASCIISTCRSIKRTDLTDYIRSLPDRFPEEICYGRRLSSSSTFTDPWNRGSYRFWISWNYIIKQLKCIICIKTQTDRREYVKKHGRSKNQHCGRFCLTH